MLDRRNSLPEGFLEVTATELYRLLPAPTLIHLPGAAGPPLFVAILQHGNEHSGLTTLQRLLARHAEHGLPRPLSLFVANVEAARAGLRRLPHQPDYNRCWPGTDEPASPETAMMATVLAEMRGRAPLAAIDLHNTTGDNPFHAGLNVLDDGCLQLASRFAPIAVHFTRPRGAMPAAFADLCPALILECGRPGDPAGIDAAERFLDDCLRLERVPGGPPPTDALELFESRALVFIPDNVRFAFGTDPGADLCLRPRIDRWNFVELPAGTVFGHGRGDYWPVRALAPDGREITAELFELRAGELRLRRALMPGLLSADERIIRQDCLCHLLERRLRAA